MLRINWIRLWNLAAKKYCGNDQRRFMKAVSRSFLACTKKRLAQQKAFEDRLNHKPAEQ